MNLLINQDPITLILLSVIGLVILIDFIENNSKKSIDKSVEKIVEKDGKKTNSFNPIDWILNRKKNITLSILIITLFKIPLHYFFENDTCTNIKSKIAGFGTTSHCVEFKDFFSSIFFDYIYIDKVSLGIGILDARLDLFIPITVVFLIVVWFFNDKIKAQ